MVSAIIVAAGQGNRMTGVEDKLRLKVANLPVVGHAWRALDSHPAIDEVILVIRDDTRTWFDELAASLNPHKPFTFTAGGEERQDSVANGLNAVSENSQWVAIHDGARPCVCAQAITDTLAKARETGAAVTAAPVTDTLKMSDGSDRIARNVDRSNLWAVQTPQIFACDIFRRALETVRSKGASVTDDTAACELIGQPVALVANSTANPKVTAPADLPLIEHLLKC